MDNQNEALDFKLKVLEDNRKIIFEGCKQIEYKAYINITLSAVLLGIIMNIFIKIDYLEGIAKMVVAVALLFFSVLNLLILFYSIASLRTFDIRCYLSYDFYKIEAINNSSGLKDNLLNEILEKYKGLTVIYNKKDTNLERSTLLLIIELSLITGMIISFFLIYVIRVINFTLA